jgi:hypothetical protein
MRRASRRAPVAVALLATGAAFGTVVPTAAADRAPSRSETSAIKRVAVKACEIAPRMVRRARFVSLSLF